MENRISKRIPADFTQNEVSGLVAEFKQRGTPFLDLTVSNPSQAGLCAEEGPLHECFSSITPTTYDPDPQGLPSARQHVASWLSGGGFQADAEALWLTSGTSEAYGYLFKLLADTRDAVAIPQPSYPLFEHLLALEGLESRPYRITYDQGWRLDLDSLEAALAGGTKAVVLVHPNNPTGSFASPSEMEGLLRLCGEQKTVLIVDEVFLSYGFSQARRSSFVSARTEIPIFVLDGLSKKFGLPQMKLSWIYLNAPPDSREEIAKRLDWIADSYLSVSTPVQLALPHLERIGRSIHTRILDRIRVNYGTLVSAVQGRKGVIDVSGEGGWTAILKLDRIRDEEHLIRDLLVEDHVLAYPGYFFDLPFPASAVLSLLPPPEVFQTGLTKLLDRS